MELESLALHFLGLLTVEMGSVVGQSLVLLERGHVFKADCRLAVGAPKHEVTGHLDLLGLLLLLVLGNDRLQELQLVVAAARILLFPFLLLFLAWLLVLAHSCLLALLFLLFALSLGHRSRLGSSHGSKLR